MNMKRMAGMVLLAGAVIAAGTVFAADGSWMDWLKGKAGVTTSTPAPTVGEAPAAPTNAMAMMGNALDIQPNDRVQGSMTAPVTMIEYASLTCPHCADFNVETMPKVKKDWIATGKLKYIMRDLAWDNLAVGMAKIARCAPPTQFDPIVTSFFANQKDIMLASDPLVQIKKLMVPFGMDSAKVDACVKDAALHKQVEDSKTIAMDGLGVRGTPAMFINGSKIDGAVDYDELKKTLDAAYAKATAAK